MLQDIRPVVSIYQIMTRTGAYLYLTPKNTIWWHSMFNYIYSCNGLMHLTWPYANALFVSHKGGNLHCIVFIQSLKKNNLLMYVHFAFLEQKSLYSTTEHNFIVQLVNVKIQYNQNNQIITSHLTIINHFY